MQWGFGVNLVKILLNSYQCIREFVHWDRGLIDPIASRLNTLLLICYLAAPRPTLDLCRWGSLTNLMLTHFSPVSHFIPSENVRKSLVFWHFQGVKKCDTGLKWVNHCVSDTNFNLGHRESPSKIGSLSSTEHLLEFELGVFESRDFSALTALKSRVSWNALGTFPWHELGTYTSESSWQKKMINPYSTNVPLTR